MGQALEKRPGIRNRSRDLAHPPRWAAILDLCPELKIPKPSLARDVWRVYLIHVEDGEKILLWGRFVCRKGHESVGFVSAKTEKRLQNEFAAHLVWLTKKVPVIEEIAGPQYVKRKTPRKRTKKADTIKSS